jgi:hypothetical protein
MEERVGVTMRIEKNSFLWLVKNEKCRSAKSSNRTIPAALHYMVDSHLPPSFHVKLGSSSTTD